MSAFQPGAGVADSPTGRKNATFRRDQIAVFRNQNEMRADCRGQQSRRDSCRGCKQACMCKYKYNTKPLGHALSCIGRLLEPFEPVISAWPSAYQTTKSNLRKKLRQLDKSHNPNAGRMSKQLCTIRFAMYLHASKI